jgi:hypothetical protein
MLKNRALVKSLTLTALLLPFVASAQTQRSQVAQADSPNKKGVTCPFTLNCDSAPPTAAFSVNNNLGVAIQGAGAHTGVFGLGGQFGVTGSGDTGLFGLGGNGPGLVVASEGPDIIQACFSTGAACSNGSVMRVDSTGKVIADGGFQTGGADVAEFVSAAGNLEPGDVVEIDPSHDGQFRKAWGRGSTAVAGVISSKPGLTMNSAERAKGDAMGPRLALVGRVRVKATAANGPIHPGDLLVSSAIPGYAMRAGKTPRPGTVFGKSLGHLGRGDGFVEMLVWSR